MEEAEEAIVTAEDAVETVVDAEDKAGSTENQERCTRQLALTAEMNAKFHSSRQKENLYIAGTVSGREDHSENPDFFIF